MSKIGKKPIEIPEGIEVKIKGQEVRISGPKGELSREVLPEIKIEKKEKMILVSPQVKSKKAQAFWGLERALLQNMVTGAKQGFKKELEIVGVGYRTNLEGKTLTLEVGFTNPVEVTIPEEIEVSVKGKIITVSGVDKTLVGQFAAKIRKVRPPDPYKGKGVRYLGEIIKLKPGKKAATGAAQ